MATSLKTTEFKVFYNPCTCTPTIFLAEFINTIIKRSNGVVADLCMCTTIAFLPVFVTTITVEHFFVFPTLCMPA